MRPHVNTCSAYWGIKVADEERLAPRRASRRNGQLRISSQTVRNNRLTTLMIVQKTARNIGVVLQLRDNQFRVQRPRLSDHFPAIPARAPRARACPPCVRRLSRLACHSRKCGPARSRQSLAAVIEGSIADYDVAHISPHAYPCPLPSLVEEEREGDEGDRPSSLMCGSWFIHEGHERTRKIPS
jgi:hypothetical protein